MNRNEITLKVRQRLDEAGVNEIVSLNFPIDPFIDEAANQVMMEIPLHLTSNIVDFNEAQLLANNDGSGTVKLPEGFVRLVEFKMNGWKCSVNEPREYTTALLQKQTNKMTKANSLKPVVAINGDKLYYFLVDDINKHEIETAKAQVYLKNIVDFPTHLANPISWLVASKVLQVMNENSLASAALKQYTQLLEDLKL